MKIIFISIFFFCFQINFFVLNGKGAQILSERLLLSILDEKELKFSKISMILLNESILIHNHPSYPYGPKTFLFDPKTLKTTRILEKFDPLYQAQLPSVAPQKGTLNPISILNPNSLPFFSEFSPEHPSTLFKLAKNPSNSYFELFVLKIEAGQNNEQDQLNELKHKNISEKAKVVSSNDSSKHTKYNFFQLMNGGDIAVSERTKDMPSNDNSKYAKSKLFPLDDRDAKQINNSNIEKETNFEKRENFYFWERVKETGENPIYREETYFSIFQKKGRIGLALSGGVLDVRNFNEIWIWERELGWVRFELGFSVWGHAMVQVGENEFVIFGGIINGEYSNKAYLIRLDYSERKALDSELKIVGDIPTARAGHKGFSGENSIFFVSGCNYELKRCFDDIIKIKIKNNLAFCEILSSPSNLPWDPRENFAGLIFSNTYFIFGGCNINSKCKESPTFLRIAPTILDLPQKKTKTCNFRGNTQPNSNNSVCICLPSYFGYYCENEFCPDSCSSHGYCDRENLECHCDDHFFGDNCESKRNCGEHGIAVEYNDKDSLKKMNVTENITKDERVSNISSNQNEFKDFYKVFLNKDFENTNMNMNYYCRCAEGWEGERCDSRRGVEGCWEFGGGYKGCFAKEKKDSDVFGFKGAIRWGARKIRFRFDTFLEKGVAMAEALVKNDRSQKQYDLNFMMESFMMKASMYDYLGKEYVLSGIMLISIEQKGPLYLQGIFHNGTAFALKGLRMGKSERGKDCFANGILMDDGSCKCFKDFSGNYCHIQKSFETYIDSEFNEKQIKSKEEDISEDKIDSKGNIGSNETLLLLNDTDEMDEKMNLTATNISEKLELDRKSTPNEKNDQVILDDASRLNFFNDSTQKIIKETNNNDNMTKNDKVFPSNLSQNVSSLSHLSSPTHPPNYTNSNSNILNELSNTSSHDNFSLNASSFTFNKTSLLPSLNDSNSSSNFPSLNSTMNITIETNYSASDLNEKSKSPKNNNTSNDTYVPNNSLKIEVFNEDNLMNNNDCKANCFENGICKNAICFCKEGYIGNFCELKIEQPCQGSFLWGRCIDNLNEVFMQKQEVASIVNENLKKRFRMKKKDNKLLMKKMKKETEIAPDTTNKDLNEKIYENLENEKNSIASTSVQSNSLLFLWAFGIIVIFICQNIRKK